MRIRELTPEDFPDAENLAREAFFAADQFHLKKESAAAWLTSIPECLKNGTAFGAFERDLSGFIVCQNDEITLLAVRPEAQGKGLATKLLQALANDAEKKGKTRLRVRTLRSLVPLYRSFGFVSEGDEEEEDGILYVQMEYLLGRSWLGKQVHVTIELPFGSYHPLYPDEEVTANKGYVDERMAEGEYLPAYVAGVKEPLDSFTGSVTGLIYHRNVDGYALIVAKDPHVLHDDTIRSIAFEEQYYDTQLIWADEEETK